MTTHKIAWLIWLVSSLVLVAYLAKPLITEKDRDMYLIGETTHGHHQIEMACNVCHTDPFGGPEVIQNACVDCHAEELELAKDSHPRSKFTDPRNADRIEILDARYCISCHTEHNEEIVGNMGLTLPEDYCFRCHEDIGEERETHKGMAFDTCASAGCHNYHDNLALYEDFLLEHAGGEPLKSNATVKKRTDITKLAALREFVMIDPEAAEASVDVVISELSFDKEHLDQIRQDWLQSQHANVGITCLACHVEQGDMQRESEVVNTAGQWNDRPTHATCQQCHTQQVEGFLLGKHGMRLAQGMSPMQVADARIVMKASAVEEVVDCMSCHDTHRFDTVSAATDGCLKCHDSDHVNNYWDSPHGHLQQEVMAGLRSAEESVTCATCHMPRLEQAMHAGKVVMVNHNQSENLRPNEKMIRPVCMGCHSLAFSIDALADEQLIEHNFSGQPRQHIRSIDMALERDAKRGSKSSPY